MVTQPRLSPISTSTLPLMPTHNMKWFLTNTHTILSFLKGFSTCSNLALSTHPTSQTDITMLTEDLLFLGQSTTCLGSVNIMWMLITSWGLQTLLKASNNLLDLCHISPTLNLINTHSISHNNGDVHIIVKLGQSTKCRDNHKISWFD